MSAHLEDLVLNAQHGDQQAFDRLARSIDAPLRKAVKARIGAHLRDQLDVDDVVQEALARMYQSLESFEWNGERAFFAWLRSIAENVILGWADKIRRREVLAVKRVDRRPSHVSPSRCLMREERMSRLERALQSLSPDHRRVIVLARLEGLQIKEVARRLQRSESAVKNLLLRALRELKRSFGDTHSLHLPDRLLTGEGEVGEGEDDDE